MVTDWIRSIIIYMLLVSALLHLLPEESYRKYVRLTVGLLLLLIVIEPVSRLFSDGSVSDFLAEKLPEETWAGQEEAFRQEAEAAQEQALCKAYETQVRESVTQYVQTQGYILREAEIEVTADGVQKMELRLAADAAKEAYETRNADGKTNEVRDTAEETNETWDAADMESEGETSGSEDSIQQQEKRLRARLCEQYALEKQAVSVTIGVE